MPLTLATAQTFIAKLSADLAAQVERQSVILPAITRQYQQQVIAIDAALTVNHTNKAGGLLTANAADLEWAPVSATLAIQRLLDDPAFYQSTLETLAQRQIDELEGGVLSLASSFTFHTALGAHGTPVTQASIDAAVSNLHGQGVPPTETLYFIVSTTPRADSTSAHQDVLALAGIQDQTKVGSGIVQSVNVNYRAPRYRGMTILRSKNIRMSGTPFTVFNLAIAPSALYLITCQMGLTNDATNVQAYSVTPKLGLRVALALLEANDNQVVTIASRGMRMVARPEYGVQVRS